MAIIHGPDAWKPRIVQLKERLRPLVFGRIEAYTDVWLPGPTVAKRLFEIRWNEEHNRHEVQVYHPCVYPPSLNGLPLLTAEPCPLVNGDVLTIDSFKIEYISQAQSSETKE